MIPEIIATGAAVTAATKIKEDSILGMLYKDTLQPSVQALGKALGSTIEFCTTPLLLCKFGSDIAKLNYQKHLDSFAEKLKSVQENERISVNPQVGAPIMERLTYTTNDEIADLFTSLLTKASSNGTVNEAHPAYIQIIDRLSIDEARILKTLVTAEFIPSISIHAYLKDEAKGFIKIVTDGTNLSAQLLFPNNDFTYLDNLKSLGILDNSHGFHKKDENLYTPIFEKYNFKQLEEQLLATGEYSRLDKKKSYYQITNFGKSFISACIR